MSLICHSLFVFVNCVANFKLQVSHMQSTHSWQRCALLEINILWQHWQHLHANIDEHSGS